jgi:hypothetical protein
MGVPRSRLTRLQTDVLAAFFQREVRDLVDVRALEGLGLSLERALAAGRRKDGGLTPGQLAWVLSQITIGDEAPILAGVTRGGCATTFAGSSTAWRGWRTPDTARRATSRSPVQRPARGHACGRAQPRRLSPSGRTASASRSRSASTGGSRRAAPE